MSRAPEWSTQNNNYGSEREFKIGDRELKVNLADQTIEIKAVNENNKTETVWSDDLVHEVNMINTLNINQLEYMHTAYSITEDVGKPKLEGSDILEENA